MTFIGTSTTSKKLQEKLESLVAKKLDILIEGETGTGRDFAARFILREESFHKIPAVSLEEEAKFYEKTEIHNLYLDNLEELNLKSQLIVQKLLETRKLELEGKSISITGNILASCSPEIHTKIKDNLFREELYAKISAIKISLPTLRERKEDILLFTKYFIDECNRKHSKKVETISETLEEFIVNYYWPGNIAQLATLLESQIVFSKGKILDKRSIPKDFLETAVSSYAARLNILPGISMEDYEREIIRANLLYAGGNREKTAKILGISERTLYRKIKKFQF